MSNTTATRPVTAGVSCGAYSRARLSGEQYLTHLAWVAADDAGHVVKGGCSNVKRENIHPDPTTYTQDRPTCPVCARKWDRLQAAQ